ncbi:hypothetical protein [Bradyrhizobium sp. CCBAU 51753]|uniref:hypothetical protein n=1 Tax=Bradyrhizobium sp. CCBAU 51753 TaxID=1325100 RepID=UPI00188D723F|nr:hypothetical protein [Bradyrhizobium sp. CCBAU 51753]QOZ27716.1 hypothetical protein XH93_31950 [Bradyrhizobium sp. CCBAU 51753]
MKLSSFVVLAVAACAGALSTARAQEAAGKAQAAAFDKRMFAGPLGAKSFACFVRRYDANHLAQHPKQKVSAMKLLVEAETVPEDKTINYSFRVGIQYRDRSGNFDSGGYCNHALPTKAGRVTAYECGVDCEGGGLTVALSNDNKSATARIGRIMVSDRSKPDAEPAEMQTDGSDDKVFRVDRAEASECAELVTDREELAALSHK